MTELKILKKAADLNEIAKTGVEYSARYGATCPICNTSRIPVAGSLPWDGNCKIRYHKCKNPECPIAVLGTTIKSVQIDR